jgi:FkbM family methyltransferase
MSLLVIAARSARDLVEMGPRFCLQGLSQLTGKGLMQVDLPGAGHMYIRRGDSDFQVLRQVFRNKEYEAPHPAVRERLRAQYHKILDTGRRPVILDAGANIGAASLWFSQVFPEAAIVAIEPDPANATLLKSNLRAIPGAKLVQAAIGGERGQVNLVNSGQSWAVQTEREADGSCPIITVEDGIAEVKNGDPFIVKIDIEGFEADLFDSDTSWIDRTFSVIIEPHDWLLPGKGTSRAFQREMGKRDFEFFIKGENIIYISRT